MIRIYTTLICRASAKAIDWLREHHIPYMEYNIQAALKEPNVLQKILQHTTDGFDSIIATKHEAYTKLKVDFNDLKFSEALEILIKNPSIIKVPIILDDEHANVEIGYNKDDIKIFGLAKTHDYKTCPLSDDECRKKTRMDTFKNDYINDEIICEEKCDEDITND